MERRRGQLRSAERCVTAAAKRKRMTVRSAPPMPTQCAPALLPPPLSQLPRGRHRLVAQGCPTFCDGPPAKRRSQAARGIQSAPPCLTPVASENAQRPLQVQQQVAPRICRGSPLSPRGNPAHSRRTGDAPGRPRRTSRREERRIPAEGEPNDPTVASASGEAQRSKRKRGRMSDGYGSCCSSCAPFPFPPRLFPRPCLFLCTDDEFLRSSDHLILLVVELLIESPQLLFASAKIVQTRHGDNCAQTNIEVWV